MFIACCYLMWKIVLKCRKNAHYLCCMHLYVVFWLVYLVAVRNTLYIYWTFFFMATIFVYCIGGRYGANTSCLSKETLNIYRFCRYLFLGNVFIDEHHHIAKNVAIKMAKCCFRMNENTYKDVKWMRLVWNLNNLF